MTPKSKKKKNVELIQEDLDQLHRKQIHEGNDVIPVHGCQLDKNKAFNNLSYQEGSVSALWRWQHFFVLVSATSHLPDPACENSSRLKCGKFDSEAEQ